MGQHAAYAWDSMTSATFDTSGSGALPAGSGTPPVFPHELPVDLEQGRHARGALSGFDGGLPGLSSSLPMSGDLPVFGAGGMPLAGI
ncbi:hypothetical protein D5S17_20375 [Pseudonocardiaceae bacterium YIM PH 21723]|nr:hypothetical protein D5S17_20375 [Pseudonocardiaceae bacterium YIM PH 21723]